MSASGVLSASGGRASGRAWLGIGGRLALPRPSGLIGTGLIGTGLTNRPGWARPTGRLARSAGPASPAGLAGPVLS